MTLAWHRFSSKQEAPGSIPGESTLKYKSLIVFLAYYLRVKQMHFDAVITKEGNLYSSWCPQLDVASSGKTIEEARANLKEAIELYLEDEDAIL